MSAEDAVRVRATVHGRVQMVGYRAFVADEAEWLGLRGTVTNCADGTVECVAEGPRTAVDELLRRLHDGPPMARVHRVDARQEPTGSQLPRMRIS